MLQDTSERDNSKGLLSKLYLEVLGSYSNDSSWWLTLVVGSVQFQWYYHKSRISPVVRAWELHGPEAIQNTKPDINAWFLCHGSPTVEEPLIINWFCWNLKVKLLFSCWMTSFKHDADEVGFGLVLFMRI